MGNESFSLWANVTLKASGSFRFCLLLREICPDMSRQMPTVFNASTTEAGVKVLVQMAVG